MEAPRRFADPVHGTIPVESLEGHLIDCASFQRLRNVGQLGLAHFVFPGANYTRLAHSLGARHVVRLSLDSPGLRSEVSERQRILYGLAGLLHDLGHYPFSHAMEDALDEFFHSQQLVEEKDAPNGDDKTIPPAPLDHVTVGKAILSNDDEIKKWLNRYKIAPNDIAEIFSRESSEPLVNLVSSDLDADRIDFLLRTAHHSGLPYGHVDLEYVLGHLTLDADHRIALHKKALRTVDHLLLCRFFDYQQVVFQKTVTSLEELLKNVLVDLMKDGKIPSTPDEVLSYIRDGRWHEYDDIHVMGLIREMAKDSPDPVAQARAKAIVERDPPRRVFDQEFLDSRSTLDDFNERRDEIRSLIPEWAEHFGIPAGHWWVWGKDATLTSTFPVPDGEDPEEFIGPDSYAKAVRILQADERTSRPITDERSSLMHILGSHALYALRIFVLLPEDRREERDTIRQGVESDLSSKSLL